MIKPVTSAGQHASAAAAMNEAVVRHAAVQESREQKRTERVADEADSGLPVDQTVIESASEELSTPDGASQGSRSQTQAAEGSSARHGAEAAGERRAGGEGLKEQQDQALAQHASEQHGKRETVRHEGERQTRSTREMMGRVESRGGPRVGGDVMAAAVGSGAATADEVAPGSAQANDRDDDNAQDVESSREAIEHRHDDNRKRVSHERSLGGQTGFHDGDKSHQDSKSGFDGRRGGTGQGAGEPGGEQSDQQHRPPAQPSTSEASPSAATEAPPVVDTLPGKADGVRPPAPEGLDGASTPSTATAPAVETPPSTAAGVEATSVEVPAGPATVVDAPPAAPERAPDSAVIAPPRPSSASSLLGMGDEYFFFDDARPQAEGQETEES